MTPQARASAIRQALAIVDGHQEALVKAGFNTYLYTRHWRSDEPRSKVGNITFSAAKQTCTTEQL